MARPNRYEYRASCAPRGHGGRLTSRSTWALIGALIVLVGALALCLDRFHNGDFYLSLSAAGSSPSTGSPPTIPSRRSRRAGPG